MAKTEDKPRKLVFSGTRAKIEVRFKKLPGMGEFCNVVDPEYVFRHVNTDSKKAYGVWVLGGKSEQQAQVDAIAAAFPEAEIELM